MKTLYLVSLLTATGLLGGCAPPHPLVQNCIDTTSAMSSSRWSCVQQANSQIYGSSPQPSQQAPAYDWNSTPTTNLTGGTTQGRQVQLQGMPNQNRPPCVSRTINGVMQSCQ